MKAEVKLGDNNLGVFDIDDSITIEEWINNNIKVTPLDNKTDTGKLYIDIITKINNLEDTYGEDYFYDTIVVSEVIDKEQWYKWYDDFRKLTPAEANSLINRIFNYSSIGEDIGQNLFPHLEDDDEWFRELNDLTNILW